MGSRLTSGLAAGAAGTAALNLATYLDMTIRARPASPLPEQDVEVMAERAGVSLGDGEAAQNRKSAAGALMGYVAGAAAGMAWGVVEPAARRLPRPVAAVMLGIGVMAATNATSARLGTTDPGQWTPGEWAADLIPHLAYGASAVAIYDQMRS